MKSPTCFVSARRSAIGKFGGTLKDQPLNSWASKVLRSALDTAGAPAEEVEQVVTGKCFGSDTRAITLAAGLPASTVSSSVYQACASGMVAIHQAHRMIQLGEVDLIAAGGVEHMSAVPYLSHSTRWGARYGDTAMEDWLKIGLSCPVTGVAMGVTAENVARRHAIGRQEQDEFAHWSQEKAAAAIKAGRFREEIVPLTFPAKRGEATVFDTDEHPRLSGLDRLGELRTAFDKEGTVTAGNASGINDAAAYCLLTSEDTAKEKGWQPLARIVAHAVSGIEPEVMGLGPVRSMEIALKRADLSPGDMDLYEINEAFAAQVLGVVREFPIPSEKLNVNGGAIALGHPVGCSGARIVVTLIHELRRRGLRRGLASLCVGGGMGAATIVEIS
jgi:acetyl-CoA C-acetyltransferase